MNMYVILLVHFFILRWNLSWNSRIHTLHSKHEEPSRSDSLLVEFNTVQPKNTAKNMLIIARKHNERKKYRKFLTLNSL